MYLRRFLLPSVFAILLSPSALLLGQQSDSRLPWKSSKIKGSPTAPEPYRIRSAFPGVKFSTPTSLAEMPDGKRMLVTERGGKIFTFRKDRDVSRSDLALDLSSLLTGDLAAKGVSLFSAVLHPQFAKNRRLFVCYVHPGGGSGKHTRVSSFQMRASQPPRIDDKSEQVIIRWPAGGHNGGCLRFGKDGYLYISTGDGFGPNPPDNLDTGQDVSDLLGSILRIDINALSENRNYAIPADNPFVGRNNARGEIWAYGLRNPWKFGADSISGEIFVADNGWESWEMVHHIKRGGNCGWPIMEGRALLRTEVKPGPTPIIPPVKDHPHSEANSVIGGPIYRGKKHSDLEGSFIYGDYITGTIWALRTDGGDEYSHRTLVDTDLRIVDFCQGGLGELFVLDYDLTGQIFELLPSERKDTSADFPRKLSQTGIFRSLTNLQPAEGVMPYRIKASRWHDGARTRRWVAIPGSGTISLGTDSQRASYPEGTVFVKHLELGKPNKSRRVETQILHLEDGQWSPYSYLWDETGEDAELAPSIGLNTNLRIPNENASEGFRERTWRVGAQNECKLCHNAGSNYVLGFNAPQLNVAQTGHPQEAPGQLERFAQQLVLEDAPKLAKGDPQALVNPHDETQSLEDRARSYLHVNCGSCHHPGGSAIISFYLRRDMPFSKLKTNKGTGIGTFGIEHAKLLTPGDPYRSIITYRMSKLGYGRMPYIGSQVVDGRGVALVSAWISSLEKTAEHSPSAPTQAGSADAKALAQLESKNANSAQRRKAINQLLESTEGALALVNRLHRRSLSRDAARQAIHLGSQSNSDVAGLFDNFLPESKRRARLGPNVQAKSILDLEGNGQRGRLIFFSDAARCRNCHDVKNAERSVGPTLQDIANKYSRRSELLQHVLQPSLKIDEKFATYNVVQSDGRVTSGLLQEQTEKQVTLKTAEGKTIRISRDKIDELRKSPRSLMPERIVSDFTAQEAADLLDFIGSLRTESPDSGN